jgi:hypothetical protein
MRLRAGDPECGPNVEVYLDGVLQTHVIEADEEAGRIVLLKDGIARLNASKTEVLTTTKYGRVRIRIWPNP